MPFLKTHKKTSRSQELDYLTRKNGLRHAIFNVVGDRYIGEWVNDYKTGKGALLTRFRPIILRQLYEGDFLNGYRHGFGVLAYQQENKIFYLEYRGGWRKGKMHGFGLRRYRDGGVYIGYWEYGKRSGYGMMWYPNGEFYAGDWVKDMRQGLGMLVRPDVCRYEGSWFADLKHGKGRFLHLNTGQMQEGVWIRDTCVYSTFKDIRYRQTTLRPTPFPITKNEMLEMLEFCERRQLEALAEIVHSCVSLVRESIRSDDVTSASRSVTSKEKGDYLNK